MNGLIRPNLALGQCPISLFTRLFFFFGFSFSFSCVCVFVVFCILYYLLFHFFLYCCRGSFIMQDNSNLTLDCWTVLVLLNSIQLQDVMTYNKCKCWTVYSVNFFYQTESHEGQETEIYCSFNWLIFGESYKIEDNKSIWTIHEAMCLWQSNIFRIHALF